MRRQEIQVKVFKNDRSPFYQAKWKNPKTGKREYQSTKKRTLREAERFAALLEEDILHQQDEPNGDINWADFRWRYEEEVLMTLANNTARKAATTLDAVERILALDVLRDVTADALSKFQRILRAEQGRRGERSEETIRSYLAHLGPALNWAADIGLLRAAPKIKPSKRHKHAMMMKGRPVATEEFERMLSKVEQIVGEVAAPSWKYLLWGLWLSGLRLDEARDLWWDRPDKLHVMLDGEDPMFRVHAEQEKGRKDRLLPMAPDFAEFLEQTPGGRRRGRVFKLVGLRGKRGPKGLQWVCRVICRIGKAAGVKVDTSVRKDKTIVKYASAQDLRRSFGQRWSQMPEISVAMLMELMRHESITTTQKYYIGCNAASASAAMRKAHETRKSCTFAVLGPNATVGVADSGAVTVGADES